jgi:phosphate starvation-inducible protein PhoH
MENTRVSRKEKRATRQDKAKKTSNVSRMPDKFNFVLKNVEPLTKNQRLTFEAFEDNYNLLLHGIAGTGKTFLSLYLGLKEVMADNSQYQRVVIVRSVVPTRDMGFLPGNNKEKARVYEAPYYATCTELFGRGDAYEYLKSKGLVEFISTSFVRGITLNDSIIVVDEIQNMDFGELDSIITRVGRNCRIIFSGDFRQSDFRKSHEKSGILDFMRIVERMKSFREVDFSREDIVRSQLVKSYIIAKDDLHIVT